MNKETLKVVISVNQEIKLSDQYLQLFKRHLKEYSSEIQTRSIDVLLRKEHVDILYEYEKNKIKALNDVISGI